HLRDPDPPRLQAEPERRHRQPRIVLHPRKTLLLGRRHENAVAQETAGRLVEEGREAEDVRHSVAKNPWTFTPRASAAFAMTRSAVATTSNPAASTIAR